MSSAEVKGAPWGQGGQVEAPYKIDLPADLPDSVVDIVLKAKDDSGETTETAVLRATKGAEAADFKPWIVDDAELA